MTIKETIVEGWKKSMGFFEILFRRLRLIRFNRDFLVFLVFLGISVAFWCMQTLKDTSTVIDEYKLKIVGLPKDVIITSEIPSTVKVSLSGRGYNHLNYQLKDIEHVVTVDYQDMEQSISKLTIDNSTMRRSVSKELGSILKVMSVTPAQIDLNYTKGHPKRVPIEFKGKIKAGLQHVLCGIEVLTKSAEVYAPDIINDSIKCVYTEMLKLDEVEDTIITRVAIKKISGAKVIPDSVDVKICVDLFTERTLSVPIYCYNIPRNKVLRTFPPKANVTFRVSATMYNEIKPNDFMLLVDFNSIKKGDKNCRVKLDGSPQDVSHIRIDPETVEYIIEEVDK